MTWIVCSSTVTSDQRFVKREVCDMASIFKWPCRLLMGSRDKATVPELSFLVLHPVCLYLSVWLVWRDDKTQTCSKSVHFHARTHTHSRTNVHAHCMHTRTYDPSPTHSFSHTNIDVFDVTRMSFSISFPVEWTLTISSKVKKVGSNRSPNTKS